MARIEITNRELLALSDDVTNMVSHSPAFRYLLMTRIDHFVKANAMSLKILNKGIVDLVKEYVLHDEEGKPVTYEKDGNHYYSFKDNGDEEKYKNAYAEFMDRSVKVEL